MRRSLVKSMQLESWPDLCEGLLSRLEDAGEDTSEERSEFAVLSAGCSVRGCPLMQKEQEMSF